MRVLTWNLFHGRAVPEAGRDLLPEFGAMLAGWDWDVALLQEVQPWWPKVLARDCGAVERHALTSRNSFLPIRRLLAQRDPDRLGANGGGCNAILVRGGIEEHRSRRLRWRPERRVVHALRLAAPAPGVWVANLHAQVHRADWAAADIELARATALAWAGRAPLVLGGDLNLRSIRIPGFVHAGGHDVDHVFVRGLEVAGPAEVLDRGELSDHAPVAVTLR